VKVKSIEISAEFFFQLFNPGWHGAGYTVLKDGIPEDARLVNVHHKWPNQLEILIESESFDDVPDGHIPPTLIPLCEQMSISETRTRGVQGGPGMAESMLIEIRALLPRTDEFASRQLPAAVRHYINWLGVRAGDPAAANAGGAL
jgi:hypothetical protein